MITVDQPEKAIILDGFRLHMNLVVDHPTNNNKAFVIGFLTSANDANTISFDTKQTRLFDISKTSDKSKLPQFSNPFDDSFLPYVPKDIIKAQYFRFNSGVILVDKKDLLENSLATNYLHNSVNESGQSIAELLFSHYLKHLSTIKDQTVQEPIVFSSQFLIEIAKLHLRNTINIHQRHINERELKMKQLSSLKVQEYIKDLEQKKQEYLAKYKQILYESIVSKMNSNYAYFINIRNTLEKHKKFYQKKLEKKKKQETDLLAKISATEKLNNKKQDHAKLKQNEKHHNPFI